MNLNYWACFLKVTKFKTYEVMDLKIKWLIIVFVGIVSSYIFFVEPGRLEISYVDKKDEPRARIVFFSDLHLWRLGSFQDRIIDEISDLEPDLILFGGDAFSDFTKPAELEQFFGKLVAIAPVYAVYGNWEESRTQEMSVIYKAAGVSLLHNASAVVDLNGRRIGITGTPLKYYLRRTRLL